MNPFGQKGEDASSATPRGFAIILTLLVLTMMTVLVIGFNAATRTEQMAARNYSYQEQAHNIAMLAVNQAVSMLNANLTNWSARTQPGRLMTLENGAMPFSSASVPGASDNLINLNVWVDTNYFIARTTNTNVFAAPLVPVISGTNTNGSYAFWVDDDGTRINLNAASVQGRTNFLPTNARPLVLAREFLSFTGNWNAFSNSFAGLIDPTNASVSAPATNGWGYFFTPRQVVAISNVGPVNYANMMFQIAGGPPNWRTTNSYALGSNGVPAALDAPGGFLATYGSAGYAGSLNSLSNAINTVAGKFFRGTNYAAFFGDAGGFADKYTEPVMRQIIANINDANLPATDVAFTGANALDMLRNQESAWNPPNNNTNVPIPVSVLGLRPSPFLNEVAVSASYRTNAQTGAFGAVELGVWMQAEIVDPYRTGISSAVALRIRDFQVAMTYQVNGAPVQVAQGTATWNYTGTITNNAAVNNNFVVASQGPSNALYFDWQIFAPTNASNFVVQSITVTPGLALLYPASSADDARSIRDWAAPQDFQTLTFSGAEVGLLSTNVPAVGFGQGRPPALRPLPQTVTFPGGAVGAPVLKSFSKNDPRVRTFGTNAPPPLAAAWTNAPATMGANNASVSFVGGTGIDGIASDATTNNAASIYDHPSFAGGSPIYALGRSNWISAFDLSRIHTGLQWRTLQFRAQTKAESDEGYVPDWALLEAFAVTNTSSSGRRAFKLNINGLPYPAMSNLTRANLATNGLSRAGAVGSLLAGMTTANAPLAAIGTNSLGFPTNAGFANAAAAMLVGSNIANMTFTNTWAARRSANADNYQTNLYTLPAEVLEVNGVSNFSTNEAANEARAQGVYSGVTVSSQVFTVYAVGFANDKKGEEVAEARLRAQVARDPNSGLFKVIFLEPLIWP